jgi:hypothetical protein
VSALVAGDLARALIRLLWDSVADKAECTCCPGDRCPQCQAMAALGLGRWKSWRVAQDKIARLSGKLLRFREVS